MKISQNKTLKKKLIKNIFTSKKILTAFYGMILLVISINLNSCNQKQSVQKEWIKTIDDKYLVWGVAEDYEYSWEGGVFENYIHGTGVLSIYKDNSLIETIIYDNNKKTYFGTTTYSDVHDINNGDEYIGKILNGTLNGIGILKKSNGEIYSGSFLDGKPHGQLNYYKKNKLAYSGKWEDGTFNGFGTLYKEDGSTKTGIWKKGKLTQTDETVKTKQGTYSGGILNNMSEGYGIMKYNSGSYYEGFWQKSKWYGKGVFVSSKQDSVIGDWQNGKLEGYGLYKSSLFLYEGDWRDNKPDGIGHIVYADSTSYRGGWSEGRKAGYGDIIYSNSDSYFGEWLEDEPNGIGRYYYNNGDRYSGEWINGLQDGVGIYMAKDFHYEGNWQQGWMHGEGKITYPNGDYYEGDFVENEKIGTGYYHFKNGNFYEGEFIEERFSGLGVFQFADGNRYEGNFTDGNIAGDGTLYFREGKTTIAITASWDGTANFPKQASVLFSNGDLYEGELVNGFPTENGTWTTEEERIKGIEIPDKLLRANEFYKKHKDTWDKAVIGISVVLTTVQLATASTGVGIPVAAAIYVVNVGLNVLDAGVAIASATIDINTALQNGEDPTEAYATLATEVSVNAALILVPKAVQKTAATGIKSATKKVVRNTTKNVVRKSIVTFTKDKPFGKVITITRNPQGRLVKTLNNSTGKLLAKVGYKRFTKNPIKDGKLKPNRKFKTGEFGNNWGHTDRLGRLSKVKTGNLQLTKREGRLPHNYNTPGKLEGDHAGHMIGDRFGGSPELDNLVSQGRKVNLSEYKKLENLWAKSLEQGKKVEVEIEIIYKGNNLRPASFNIKYKIDGKSYSKIIKN